MQIKVETYVVTRDDNNQVVARADRTLDPDIWYITLRLPGTGSVQTVEYVTGIPNTGIQDVLADASLHAAALWDLAEAVNSDGG